MLAVTSLGVFIVLLDTTIINIAGYVFASSLVDLYGFINQVVAVAAVPSIALRVILGAVLVWLIPARNGLGA